MTTIILPMLVAYSLSPLLLLQWRNSLPFLSSHFSTTTPPSWFRPFVSTPLGGSSSTTYNHPRIATVLAQAVLPTTFYEDDSSSTYAAPPNSRTATPLWIVSSSSSAGAATAAAAASTMVVPSPAPPRQRCLKWLAVYAASPWTVSRSWSKLRHGWRACPWGAAWQHAQSLRQGHATILPAAWQALAQALAQNRAYRQRGYDVYLPPALWSATSSTDDGDKKDKDNNPNDTTTSTTTTTTTTTTTLPAIVFFPGMGVSYVAYARPAQRLANLGYVVVLVSGEPWRALFFNDQPRYATPYLKRHILQRVQHDLQQQKRRLLRQQQILLQANHKNPKKTNTPLRLEWYLAGHSLGGYTATFLAADWIQRQRREQPEQENDQPGEANNTATTTATTNHNNVILYGKVAMWGSMPVGAWIPDLTPFTSEELSLLMIHGTADVLVHNSNLVTAAMKQDFVQKLPPLVVTRDVEGGTHSGYADYQSASPVYVERNTATTRSQQQAAVVHWTHRFFSSPPSSQQQKEQEEQEQEQE
ncbi:hypothetical protein ACA910_004540 [Epithemia clementina (nom. ined.)]